MAINRRRRMKTIVTAGTAPEEFLMGAAEIFRRTGALSCLQDRAYISGGVQHPNDLQRARVGPLNDEISVNSIEPDRFVCELESQVTNSRHLCHPSHAGAQLSKDLSCNLAARPARQERANLNQVRAGGWSNNVLAHAASPSCSKSVRSSSNTFSPSIPSPR